MTVEAAAARDVVPKGPPLLTQDERRLVAALRAGGERAFVELVDRHAASMLRVARLYVSSRAVAEEVVQEAFLGVVAGIGRFEGRSSLRTWVFRILTNCAKTRGARESRSVPFSAFVEPGEPTVDPDRFLDGSHRWAGHWASSPARFDTLPEERLLAGETRRLVGDTIATLPPAQRAVITLRDVEGWEAAEVCECLQVSEGNQRVLLHRARARVRERLEQYVRSGEGVEPSQRGAATPHRF